MTAQQKIRIRECKTRTCSAPIVWAYVQKAPKAKVSRMPLEANPETGEPMEFEDNGKAGRIQIGHRAVSLLGEPDQLLVRVLENGEIADPELPIWQTHFVTCPDSEAWRNKNR